MLRWFREQEAEPAGVRWFAQLMAAIDTLETIPERCAVAEESADIWLGNPRASCRNGPAVYRVLFQIRGRAVHILRLWHTARGAISRDDL